MLGHLVRDEYAVTHVKELLKDEDTFAQIKRVLKAKPAYLSVTIPREWYQNN